jgi:hypothetical protein
MSAVRQKRHSVHLPVGDAAGVSGLRGQQFDRLLVTSA